MIEDEEFDEKFFEDVEYTQEDIESIKGMVRVYVGQIEELQEKMSVLSSKLEEGEPFFKFLSRISERTKIWREIEITKSLLGGLIVDNFSIVNFGVAHGDKAE